MKLFWPSWRREFEKVLAAEPQIPAPHLTQPKEQAPTASEISRALAEIEQESDE